jgi:hypothetical protein
MTAHGEALTCKRCLEFVDTDYLSRLFPNSSQHQSLREMSPCLGIIACDKKKSLASNSTIY